MTPHGLSRSACPWRGTHRGCRRTSDVCSPCACTGPVPPPPTTFSSRTERRLLAVQTERHVQRVGLRAERHRAPALESGRARTHVHLDADLRNLAGPVRHLAGLRIHLDDVLVAEIGRVDERAGRRDRAARECPSLPILNSDLRPPTSIEDVLEHFVHVLRLAGQVLVVPLHLSGVGIERERRVRVERVAVGAADGSRPRLGLRRAPVDEVRRPDRSCPRSTRRCRRGTCSGRSPQVSPPGSPGRAIGRRAPQLLAGRRIVAGDEADVVLVAAASGDPRNHLAAHDDRAGRVFVAQLRIGDRRVPDQLPGPRVEGDDVRVVGRAEDLVAEDRDVSLNAASRIAAAGWRAAARDAGCRSALRRRARGCGRAAAWRPGGTPRSNRRSPRRAPE